MTCTRCGADFSASDLPGRVPWCPTCVAKLCCSQWRTCVHRPPRSSFGRAAIAAAAILLASCGQGSGGGESLRVAMPSTTLPAPVDQLPSTDAISDIRATTSTRLPPPRASRSRSAPSRAESPPSPPRRAPTGSGTATNEQLDALARCESGMDPRKNTGNGYFGAFQWKLSTWHGMGMSGNPVDYSYEAQRDVARRIPLSAWPRQFPGCSRKLGIR